MLHNTVLEMLQAFLDSTDNRNVDMKRVKAKLDAIKNTED